MRFLKTLFGCCFVWHIRGANLHGADVIIAHAGGDAMDGSPGKINEYLASIIRDIYKESPLPIVAQGELAEYLRDLPLVGNIPRQRDAPKYIDTVDVARIHLEECRKSGFKLPILVSYQPHLWRAKKVSEKLGLKVVVADVPRTVYDKDCSQWQMRSPLFNYPRELLCRLVWLIQGKI